MINHNSNPTNHDDNHTNHDNNDTHNDNTDNSDMEFIRTAKGFPTEVRSFFCGDNQIGQISHGASTPGLR